MPKTEMQGVFRGMLRDVVECSEFASVCRQLGLVPAGPDVDEIEHYQSHIRLQGFSSVAAETISHADIAAEVILQLTRMDAHGDQDDEESERTRLSYTLITRTACTAVISHLLHQGILRIGDSS
ncbi:hypothetical protein ACFQ61_08425 [Streptomyces sp. NPDC056500]|uniref:hypothetical protein n=1 Tax=Streptomyces sp. NPDC056500 TaxID=3345840 RepID=UPI0036844DD2